MPVVPNSFTTTARSTWRVVAAFGLAAGMGCSAGAGNDVPAGNLGPGDRGADTRMRWLYSPLGAPSEPEENGSTSAKVDLGRLLFHDPVLSADHATACVTCHSQYWGMGDGLPFGIGVGGTGPAGIGRRGSTTTRRNVPTLWNVAYRTALFWDGRVSSLEEQVEVPLFDFRELGANRETMIRELGDNSSYRALFASAFPESPEISLENLTRAIATFVRTIITNDAPYDRYARGDDNAMSASEVRGMRLFGELGCASCHVPPLFAADRYDAVALGGPAASFSPASDDLGRFEITGDEADRFAFRVPQLRNLRETGPYFHDGRAPTMLDAVRQMVLATSPRAVSGDELAALAEFTGKSLMDKAHVPERPLAVPSGLPVPADGFIIRR